METYKAVKTQYNDLQLRLLKLEILAEQKTRFWFEADCKDRKASKEMTKADKDVRDMQRSVKDVAYKLVVLEYKEFGTSINKLSREHGISPLTIKKLLKENGVAYLRPTLVQWLPIGTAPKDGTVVLGFADNEDGTVFLSEIMWCKNNETIIGVTDSVVGPNQWFSLLLSGSVSPSHWMPLPEPPALGEKKDD